MMLDVVLFQELFELYGDELLSVVRDDTLWVTKEQERLLKLLDNVDGC
jgi:hypothetical protein